MPIESAVNTMSADKLAGMLSEPELSLLDTAFDVVMVIADITLALNRVNSTCPEFMRVPETDEGRSKLISHIDAGFHQLDIIDDRMRVLRARQTAKFDKTTSQDQDTKWQIKDYHTKR